MREYGKVHTSFWTSADTQQLSDDGRMLAFYLLTSPHTTIIGCFRLPDGYVCEDLKWTVGRVCKGFEELFRNGFANRCETTKWVWISRFLKWNQPENPNQWKAADKIIEQIPSSCAWKQAFMRVVDYFKLPEDDRKGNPFETLSKPFRNQDQEQEQDLEQEQEQEQEQECLRGGLADPPRRAEKLAKSSRIWEAYSEAYQRRYKAEPTRNAKVNGQLTSFASRVPEAEAPQIAAFYLTHNGQRYVASGHAVGLLLQDAEKLRTEYLTGRKITNGQAREADRLQGAGDSWNNLIAEAENGKVRRLA